MRGIIFIVAGALFFATATTAQQNIKQPSSFSSEGQPVISILYFDDNSTQTKDKTPNYLGKAIVELASADLSNIKGLVFVEREKLETALKELEFDVSGAVDEKSSPRIGEFLGAQWLVLGSYIVNSQTVNVAFKIISVENGQILKAGRVSGVVNDVGALVDLLSAAIATALTEAFPAIDASEIVKQKISERTGNVNLDTIKGLGRALDLEDAGKVAEARDLVNKLPLPISGGTLFKEVIDSLDQRLIALDKRHAAALANVGAALPKNLNDYMKTTTALISSNKVKELLDYCLKVSNAKLKFSAEDTSYGTVEELNGWYILMQLRTLKRFSEVVNAGEKYLHDYPASPSYQMVEMWVREAAKTIKVQEGKMASIEDSINNISSDQTKYSPQMIIYLSADAWYNGEFYQKALSLFLQLDLYKPKLLSIPGDTVIYKAFDCANRLLSENWVENNIEAMTTYRDIALRLSTILNETYPNSNYKTNVKNTIDIFSQPQEDLYN